MNEQAGSASGVDLTNCDREEIHLLGRVQESGFLVACTSDWLIANVSENVSQFASASVNELVGSSLEQLISNDIIHSLRNRLQNLGSSSLPDVVSGVRLSGTSSDALFDISVHVASGKIILEFERHEMASMERHILNVQQAIHRIASLKDVDQILKYATRFVSAMAGYDRVMAYVFAPDGTGEVRAETAAPGVESFLGLRYPASDIPKQARELYLHNPVRTIHDSGTEGARILPDAHSRHDVIDLSKSVLRSVSSIHLEYLRNMGVTASMSVSLIVDGQLFGLIACHHRSPRVLSQSLRSSIVLFGQMISLLIAGKLSNESKTYLSLAGDFINNFSRSAATRGDIASVLIDHAENAMSMMRADGMVVVSNGNQARAGLIPTPDEILVLCKRLNAMPPGQVFSTSHLAELTPQATSFADRAAGMLSIPISKTPRDYILFFRREVVRNVKWAGDPNKPVTLGPNGPRLTPRKSFETWQATVSGQSEEWTVAELSAAEQFRITVLEVVLRMVEEAAGERKKAAEKQELLIAELNHRVRNILGLVRGLISQTSKADKPVEEFASVLETRIQSLARAHDQITRKNWSASSLRDLIATEADAYLGDKANRVNVSGPDFTLVPVAYSSLALVIHEMITNAAKYGALADSRGTVDVELSVRNDGSLDIKWTERNGPPVVAPSRRGFGSTIVEKSIPFELNGEAEIEYRLEGVRARFWIPSMHIGEYRMAQTVEPPVSVSDDAGVQQQPRDFPRNVLLVEDNLIIAMDTEEVLYELGAEKVTVCADVTMSLAAIQSDVPEFALLDVNLGRETSMIVAETLKTLGTPYVFASGYGDNMHTSAASSGVAVVAKPYDKETLRKAIAETLKSAGSDK